MSAGSYDYVIVEPGRRAVYWLTGCRQTPRAGLYCLRRAGGPDRAREIRSGIGEPDQLRAAGVEPRHELVGGGANLRDHRTCAVIVHCPKPVTLFAADSRSQLARFLIARRGMLTSSVNEAVAFVRSDPTLTAPDLELVWLPVPVLGEGLTPHAATG
jgi:choline dehydrogenase-like flavoprotein